MIISSDKLKKSLVKGAHCLEKDKKGIMKCSFSCCSDLSGIKDSSKAIDLSCTGRLTVTRWGIVVMHIVIVALITALFICEKIKCMRKIKNEKRNMCKL